MGKLIVALDVEDCQKALDLIDILSPKVEIFKVGVAPFVNFGDELLKKLQSLGKKVFLDLKFHDIPNTVKNVVKAASRKGVYMINLHCLGGMCMLQAAAEGLLEVDVAERPLLIGVTILTSMNAEDMQGVGLVGSAQEKVIDLARLAKEAGLDGVVASAKEAKTIKEKVGKDFIVVTLGIRPEWNDT